MVNFSAQTDNLEATFITKTPRIINTIQEIQLKLVPKVYEINSKFIPIISIDENSTQILNSISNAYAYNELKDNYFSSDFYQWLNDNQLVTNEFNNYINQGYSTWIKNYNSTIKIYNYNLSNLGFSPGMINNNYIYTNDFVFSNFNSNKNYTTVNGDTIVNLYDTMMLGVGIDYSNKFINLVLPKFALLYVDIYNNDVVYFE